IARLLRQLLSPLGVVLTLGGRHDCTRSAATGPAPAAPTACAARLLAASDGRHPVRTETDRLGRFAQLGINRPATPEIQIVLRFRRPTAMRSAEDKSHAENDRQARSHDVSLSYEAFSMCTRYASTISRFFSPDCRMTLSSRSILTTSSSCSSMNHCRKLWAR